MNFIWETINKYVPENMADGVFLTTLIVILHGGSRIYIGRMHCKCNVHGTLCGNHLRIVRRNFLSVPPSQTGSRKRKIDFLRKL